MIDQGLPKAWPVEVMQAIDKFKQGHLVERPPFFYAASAEFGIWQFTRDVGDPSFAEDLFQIDPTDGPPYGLIVTQTCDINEQALLLKQPWIQVCPVYRGDNVLDPGQQGHVRRGRMGHLIALSPPSLRDGLWLADLRIEFPIEKSWLVARTPIEAFAHEKDYLDLADRLAQRRGRPAFANAISEQVIGPLRTRLNKLSAKRQHDILDKVRELRLQVDGQRLLPTSARLIVIFADDADSEDREKVIQWFDDWWTEVQSETTARGLPLLANRYGALDEIPTRIYAASTFLNFAYLSPDV